MYSDGLLKLPIFTIQKNFKILLTVYSLSPLMGFSYFILSGKNHSLFFVTSDGIFLFYSLWQESFVILCHRRFFHTRSTTVEQPCRQLLSAHGYADHYLHACCLTPTSKSSPVPALLTAAAPRGLTHTDVSDLPAPLTYRFYPMEFPAW